MHSNPSSLSLCTSYCSPSKWKVASRLILADTICQFVLFFIATINHHACMYANDQNFVKPERKTGKSNKSCAHVWKKRPWLGRSEATCHQIDPVTRQPVVAGGDMPTGLWHQPVTGCHIKGRKTKLYKPYSGIWNWYFFLFSTANKRRLSEFDVFYMASTFRSGNPHSSNIKLFAINIGIV